MRRRDDAAGFSCCPSCGRPSSRVHCQYRRRVADVPSAGRQVCLEITARRFRCIAPNCRQYIFAERFDGDAVTCSAQRTDRQELIVHHLGLALGGTSWKTPAPRSWTRFANRCGRSARRSVRPSSILSCSPARNGCNMKDFCDGTNQCLHHDPRQTARSNQTDRPPNRA